MVPSHRPVARQDRPGPQHLRQPLPVVIGQHEGRSESMLALDGGVARDPKPLLLKVSQQDAADLNSAMRRQEEGVDHRQANVVKYPGGVLDIERALRRAPRNQGDILASLHRFTLILYLNTYPYP